MLDGETSQELEADTTWRAQEAAMGILSALGKGDGD